MRQNWNILEFLVPIKEIGISEAKIKGVGDFIVSGIAINECTTLNNVKYVAEELQKAAPSFKNKPLLLDHKNEIRNIVGRVFSSTYSIKNKRIDFEGNVADKQIQEMIRDGRIQNVSIGAKVKDLVEERDGSKRAVGIIGLEISFVAVPGDSQASLTSFKSFTEALENSFQIKESLSGGSKMEYKNWTMQSLQAKKIELENKITRLEKDIAKNLVLTKEKFNDGSVVTKTGKRISYSMDYTKSKNKFRRL